MNLISFRARVEFAIDAYLKLQTNSGRPTLPIDVDAVAAALGNIDIERREMIREAAMEAAGSRFRIYLQSNFVDRHGIHTRQRFSLAHEIADTFFYARTADLLRPIKGAPRGISLESACHEGARRLLIPERFLLRELAVDRGVVRGEDVVRLAKEVFDVSLEVFLRRLGGVLDPIWTCFALTRDHRLKYAMYPVWLRSVLREPPTGLPVSEWLRASNLEIESCPDGSYVGCNGNVAVTARRITVSQAAALFEIQRSSRGTLNGDDPLLPYEQQNGEPA